MSNNNKGAGYYIGYAIGIIFMACLTAIVGTLMVGITLKFLSWFIGWLF